MGHITPFPAQSTQIDASEALLVESKRSVAHLETAKGVGKNLEASEGCAK